MNDLEDAIAGLAEEIQPDRDLWPGIEARLAARRSTSRMLRPLAAAALVLAGVGLGMWATWPAEPPPPVAEVTWQAEMESASARLSATLAGRRSELDPVTVGIIEANLAIIDEAIDECARALEADPSNAQLEHRLADTWRRRIDLLRHATDLPSGS